MNPLSIRSLFHSVATLINLPRLHGLKIIYELQKEPNYLLKKPFLEKFQLFWNACTELSKKNEKKQFSEQPSGSLLKKHCVGFSFESACRWQL